MSISVEQLASLADNRTLSTVFEQAWHNRTGVNPVLCALKIVKFKREKLSYKITRFLVWVAFVSSLLAMVSLLMHSASPVESTTVTLADIIDGLAIALLFVIAFASVLFLLFSSVLSEKVEYDRLSVFCDDLEVFFRHEPIDKWGCSAQSSPEQLREHAFKILVDKAMAVLTAKKLMDSTAEDQKHVDAVVQHGQRLTDLAMTYDALNRIGMASGGFEPAFKMAKKQMAEAQK
ncbi:MAG: hypothetical protein AAB555_01070 [Patescibacteria group bacterium]